MKICDSKYYEGDKRAGERANYEILLQQSDLIKEIHDKLCELDLSGFSYDIKILKAIQHYESQLALKIEKIEQLQSEGKHA